MNKLVTIVMILTALAVNLSAQGKGNYNGMEVLGAGATFPQVLYSKMFSEYNKATGLKVNYQAIGSGGGIKQLTEKTVDFGGTDAFMSDAEIKKTGGEIVHIPTCIGSVVLTYNLPGNPKLKMTPEIISGIYLGKITKWSDPAIAKENPGVKIPAFPITVVRRSDGSGTTFVFTDYLTKVSADWKAKVGTGKDVNWPVGLGGKGNAGVQGIVKQTPGSIGYVELIFAVQNKMAYADVKNRSGVYITPSLKSASLAAAINMPADTKVSITDTPAKDGYPIASFTWLVLYKEQNYNNKSLKTADAVVNMIWWMTHEGQSIPQTLDFSPIPAPAQKIVESLLKSVTYDGKPILK